MSLSIDFLGVRLRNRTVLASGILGVSIASLKKVFESGAGIVTTKSIGPCCIRLGWGTRECGRPFESRY